MHAFTAVCLQIKPVQPSQVTDVTESSTRLHLEQLPITVAENKAVHKQFLSH